MKVFIPGGAGYVGSKLVPALLDQGYETTVYDLFLFGEDVLQPHPRLRLIKGDVRDLPALGNGLKGHDAVIHLACISNDPSFELDPALGKSINLDCFEPFVLLCKQYRVQRFIYASSSSVYGIKEVANVTEGMPLDPLTDYSRFKAECESILFRHISDDFICTVLRPATVCGYAPRQRLDVVVNILTNLAYRTGKVKVMGGGQMRPNIHIDDMVKAYLCVLQQTAEKVQGETFNVGYHNHTVMELGKMVRDIVGKTRPVELVVEPTNDNRSYHVSSRKIAQTLGFSPEKSIEDAVRDLLWALENGKLPNSLEDPRYFNIKTINQLSLQGKSFMASKAGWT